MAITYSMSLEPPLLRVTASGIDDSLGEVQAYGAAILQACVESGCTRVLCDERELIYNLSVFDTYELARVTSELAPGLGKAAIVCNQDNVSDAQFWETVAVNRGLMVRVFLSLAEAETWLQETIA